MVCSGNKKLFFLTLAFSLIFLIGLFSSPVFFAKKVSAATIRTSVTITVCGNGVVESGEQCDDANALNTDACLNTCKTATCGDGFVRTGVEGCDDGNIIAGDGCSATCQIEVVVPPTPPGGGGGGGGGGGPTVTRVLLKGIAYPKAGITILVDGRVVTIISADSNANFNTEITTLTGGLYTFGVWAEDSLGRRSITFSFTVSITDGMTTTISGIFIPPTIELEKTNLLKGETLKIVGQTAPESELSIHVESAEIIKTAVAQKTGDWKYALDTTVLEEGSHTTRVKAETQAGILSSFSKVLGFYIGKYGSKEICPQADFNKDGKTNLTDFSIMLYWWGKYNTCVDQNQDGVVNLPDFSILMYYWTG